MADQEMIRIRLKAYDHQLIDASAGKIVETALSATALPFPTPSAADKKVIFIIHRFVP